MRRALVASLAAFAAAALLAAPPAGAASAPAPHASPNPFRHGLALVDGHLRTAIEYAPQELGESLRTAEIVCGLGERSLARQEADAAAADWATLGQVVDRLAVAQARRVQIAFRNADSVLADLRARFERRWRSSPPHLRELRRGVRATRRGITAVRAAITGLESPFASWRAEECRAATRGVEKAFAAAPAGIELINKGMLRLWRLAEEPPPRTQRS